MKIQQRMSALLLRLSKESGASLVSCLRLSGNAAVSKRALLLLLLSIQGCPSFIYRRPSGIIGNWCTCAV